MQLAGRYEESIKRVLRDVFKKGCIWYSQDGIIKKRRYSKSV